MRRKACRDGMEWEVRGGRRIHDRFEGRVKQDALNSVWCGAVEISTGQIRYKCDCLGGKRESIRFSGLK